LKTHDNEERRIRVIELRKEGKTIREICTEMHMTSRTVIRILKEDSSIEAQEEELRKAQEQQNALQTNYTRALKLFKEGKNLLDVTIELGLFAEETKRAFYDFQEISGVDDFRAVYEDIKPFISALLTLWGMMRERGLGVKDALVAIEYANNRAKAEKELQDITTKVSDMENRENRAYLLEKEIFASKLQMLKPSDFMPPPAKAASKGIVAPGDQPKAKEPSADNHCSDDFNTGNKH
jgi:AraC-like DNA-binding protein